MITALLQAVPRPVRVLLDIALRAGGLVACAALLSSLSDENDALAAGLTELCTVAVLAFAVALLDGAFRRDRARLVVVWAVVVPLVGSLKTASFVQMVLGEPGGYPSLALVPRGDILESFLTWAVLAGLPAVVGLVLGVAVRLATLASAQPAGGATVRRTSQTHLPN